MTLSEYDHVVQDLAPEGAGKALGVAVLPGRPGRGLELADAEIVRIRSSNRLADGRAAKA
jgi:hypothetical protein